MWGWIVIRGIMVSVYPPAMSPFVNRPHVFLRSIQYPLQNIALGLSRIVSHDVHSRGLQMTPTYESPSRFSPFLEYEFWSETQPEKDILKILDFGSEGASFPSELPEFQSDSVNMCRTLHT